MQLGSVPGKINNAVQLSYNLPKGGWALITKNLLPNQLVGTTGISFFYKGSGGPNTIEVKLMLRYPGAGDDTTYGFRFYTATETGGAWQLAQVPYSDFSCWWQGAECSEYPRLDLTKVLRMDLAVSNQPGDTAGSGTVAFDQVEAFR